MELSSHDKSQTPKQTGRAQYTNNVRDDHTLSTTMISIRKSNKSTGIGNGISRTLGVTYSAIPCKTVKDLNPIMHGEEDE